MNVSPVIGQKRLFVIAGPTASGKSKLALDLANIVEGEIVNADALQVYREIPILSCAPGASEQYISHHLYNYVPVTESYSVGKYIEDAKSIIGDIALRNKIPILVGGTGMYIKSLCYGMHNIPTILPKIREEARQKFQELGNEKFYQELQKLDPVSGALLHHSNSHRIIRAYEVFIQTRQSITEFYKNEPSLFLKEYKITTIILEPDREKLYDTCNKRFIAMLEEGALEEVDNIKQKYDYKTAASKAIGFDELSLYLSGVISKEEAIMKAQARTRQYAKRQMTWFRHQMPEEVVRIAFDKTLPGAGSIMERVER